MVWDVTADPTKSEEAIAWFRARVPMLESEWEALTEAAKRHAFKVAGATRIDMVADVMRAIESALENGDSLEDFKSAVGDMLTSQWGGSVDDPPWRLETIFRTNTQSAYAAGRHKQMSDPVVKKHRPYWMFDAVIDRGTTDICKELHGTIVAQDDPWWNGRFPPCHFNCRSSVRSLRKSQAEARGITTSPPTIKADEGFGQRPAIGEWEPDPDDYPQELRPAVEKLLSQ